jgi:hypothetical protein
MGREIDPNREVFPRIETIKEKFVSCFPRLLSLFVSEGIRMWVERV